MKAMVAFALMAAHCLAQADPIVTDIELLGNKVGENLYETKADGSFKSETAITVGTVKISATCVGKLNRDGAVTELEMNESQGAANARVIWKTGKLTAWSQGKEVAKDVALPWDGKVFMHPYHPKMLAGLKSAADKTPGKPVKALSGQGFIIIDVVASQTPVTVNLERGNQSVSMLDITISGITLRSAFDASGTLRGFAVPPQNYFAVERGWTGLFVDPLSKYPELPKPTYTPITETGLKMTTPDGATLVADVVRPNKEGKYPVILMRTPYGRAASALAAGLYVRRGYVVVAQDVRGMGDSTGAWDPFNHEVSDGKSTLDWLVQQPWCDGNVGMIGASYGGMVQWAAAVNHHPALKCIIPQVSPPDPVHNIPWDHGAFLLMGNVWWSRIVADKTANMEAVAQGIGALKPYARLPISKVDDAVLKRDIPFFNDWVKRDTIGEWAGVYRADQIASVKIPILHISGFWDGDAIGTKMHWEAQRAAGGNQWLVYGPWEHGFNMKSEVAGVNYGKHAVIDLDSLYIRFFETYLKGKSVKMEAQPRARVFVSGMNQWMTGSDWPFPFTKRTTWYLGGGNAKDKTSKGTLDAKPGDHSPDSYTYDPIKIGRKTSLGSENSFVMSKSPFDPGTLSYVTSPFQSRTMITGPFEAELCVSTTAKDATFHAMILDRRPDGKHVMLGLPGTQRLTYLGGEFHSLTPHKVYRFKLNLWDFAHAFEPGHQMVLVITSDMYPKYARNPGTGERDETATRLIKATHTVYKVRGLSSKLTAQTYSW